MNEQTVEMDPGSLPPPAGPPVGGREPERTPGGRQAGDDPWYRRRVSRDTNGRWIGGVVNGVSKAFGFDVRTTRIALAVATLVMPVLIIVYLVAWILLPDTPAQARPLQDLAGGRKRLPLLVVLGGILLLGGFASIGSWHILGGIPWGVGLIAVGVLLWLASDIHNDAQRAQEAALPEPPVPPIPPTPPTTQPIPVVPLGPTELAPGTPAPSAADQREIRRQLRHQRRAERREERRIKRAQRIPIGLFSVLTALGFLAIGAAGDALDWWDLPILTGTIVVLVILALGAAISAVVNRSWRTVPLLVLLTAVIGLLSVSLPHLDGGVGERSVRPVSVAQAQTLHELGIGHLDIDLTEVPLAPGEVVHVRAVVGIGQLSVTVPADVALDLQLEVGAGAVTLDDKEIASGLRHEEQRVEPPLVPSTTPPATIQIDGEVGMGHIQIERNG